MHLVKPHTTFHSISLIKLQGGYLVKVITIGESLIDFVPNQIGKALKDVTGFTKSPGGAPANVAACVSRLGGKSQIITKLGMDSFGDFLVEKMGSVGIDCSSVSRTNAANTALAFVSLREDGERDFAFYRNPSADMLLEASEIQEGWFEPGDILHFCSVDLVDAPVRAAHDRAIEIARRKMLLVSFDPNVRLALWQDHDEYRRIINHYIHKADILKVSSDELEFITGMKNEAEALDSLFAQVRVLVFTKGAAGAEIWLRGRKGGHSGFHVDTVDTTGAGDAFIGALLFQLQRAGMSVNPEEHDPNELAAFSNAAAAIVTTRKGAIDAMPTYSEVERFLYDNRKDRGHP